MTPNQEPVERESAKTVYNIVVNCLNDCYGKAERTRSRYMSRCLNKISKQLAHQKALSRAEGARESNPVCKCGYAFEVGDIGCPKCRSLSRAEVLEEVRVKIEAMKWGGLGNSIHDTALSDTLAVVDEIKGGK